MPLRKSPAVVVRALDYGEADRIITFVAPEAGRLTGIAKGAKKSRRRFGAALELFTLVSLTYFEKPAFELVRLEGAEILSAFADARRDLTKIAHAAYLVEAAGRVVQPREPAHGVFRLLVETLKEVDREPPDEGRLRAFELQLLSLLGYHPELRHCARCRRPRPAEGRFRVSLRAGGLLCRRCVGDVAPPDPPDRAGLVAEVSPPAARSAAGSGTADADGNGVRQASPGLGAPDSDLVPVSGRLLDRLAALLDAPEGSPERLTPLRLTPEEAAEARVLLPRFLSAHVGIELKALRFLEGLG